MLRSRLHISLGFLQSRHHIAKYVVVPEVSVWNWGQEGAVYYVVAGKVPRWSGRKCAQVSGTHALLAKRVQRVWVEWVVGAGLCRSPYLEPGLLSVLWHDLLHYHSQGSCRWRSAVISRPFLTFLQGPEGAFYFTDNDSMFLDRSSHLPKVKELRGLGRSQDSTSSGRLLPFVPHGLLKGVPQNALPQTSESR